MPLAPLTDDQQRYYLEQERCWRAYVKQCCDRNDLMFPTFAEWLFMDDSRGEDAGEIPWGFQITTRNSSKNSECE